MVKFSFIIIIVFLMICCRPNNKHLWQGQVVEGNIIQDSILDGPIAFYDTGGIVVERKQYNDGLLNGIDIKYYLNGSKMDSVSYINNQKNGFHYSFDSLGNIVYEDYFLLGRAFGPIIYRENGKLKNYYFYSFGGTVLCYYEYDESGSIINSKNSKFIYPNTLPIYEEGKWSIFLYTPHPSRILMHYQIVTQDTTTGTTEIEDISDNTVYYQSIVDTPKHGIQFKIRLTYFDSTTNKGGIVSMKVSTDSSYNLQKAL